ncbi:AAA family ATPase [Paraglaciecola aestuariivivens]
MSKQKDQALLNQVNNKSSRSDDIVDEMSSAFEEAIKLSNLNKQKTKEPDPVDELDSVFDDLFDEIEFVSPPLFDKKELEKSLSQKTKNDFEPPSQFLLQNPCKRLCSMDKSKDIFSSLRKSFPNFTHVIDFYEGQLAISRLTGKPLNIPPVNLQGPPGIGKTVFVQALAEAIGHEFFEIAISGMQAEFELVGGHNTWTRAEAGAIATTLIIKAETYNPIILLDEICLLNKNERVNMYHPLYSVLDKEQARRFRDLYLDVLIDVSNAIYITTTNNFENVPAAVSSRLTNFVVKAPSYEQMYAIIPTVFKSVLEELSLGHYFNSTLPVSCLEVLAQRPPREIKLKLKAAVGKAVARVKDLELVSLQLSDFTFSDPTASLYDAPRDVLH